MLIQVEKVYLLALVTENNRLILSFSIKNSFYFYFLENSITMFFIKGLIDRNVQMALVQVREKMTEMMSISNKLYIRLYQFLLYKGKTSNCLQKIQSNMTTIQHYLSIPQYPKHFDTVSEASTDGDEHEQDWGTRSRGQWSNSKINKSNIKIKTSLCKKFSENGFCPYGQKCQFAHGVHELRCKNDDNKYKTRSCNAFFKKGYCCYGPRCNFSHNAEDQIHKTKLESTVLPGFRQVLYNGKSQKESRMFFSSY